MINWETSLPGEHEVGEMLARDNGQLFRREGTPVIEGRGEDYRPSVWAGNDMKHGIVDNLNVGAAFP